MNTVVTLQRSTFCHFLRGTYIYISKIVDATVAGPLLLRGAGNYRRMLWHMNLKSTSVHTEASVTAPVQ